MRRVRLCLVAIAALLLAACRHVAPYERGILAHPSMTTVGTPGPAEAHVYSVHEGAVGGGGAAESGCGCN